MKKLILIISMILTIVNISKAQYIVQQFGHHIGAFITFSKDYETYDYRTEPDISSSDSIIFYTFQNYWKTKVVDPANSGLYSVMYIQNFSGSTPTNKVISFENNNGRNYTNNNVDTLKGLDSTTAFPFIRMITGWINP